MEGVFDLNTNGKIAIVKEHCDALQQLVFGPGERVEVMNNIHINGLHSVEWISSDKLIYSSIEGIGMIDFKKDQLTATTRSGHADSGYPTSLVGTEQKWAMSGVSLSKYRLLHQCL
jgi:hypothetical protein